MAQIKGIESSASAKKTMTSDLRRQTPPKPGSYSGGSAEQAANRAETIPSSKSPGPPGQSENELTSRQPGPRGPFASTSDDARAAELLKPWSNPGRKPDLLR